MEKQKGVLLKKAKSLMDFIMDYCTDEKGVLRAKVDLKKRKAFGEVMVDDIGDCTPFFYWLGKYAGSKYSEWAEEQTLTLLRDLNTKGKIIPIINYGDTLLGSTLMYELTRKNIYLEFGENMVDTISKAISRDSLVSSYKVFGMNIPIAAGTFNGLFIEEAARIYEFSGVEKYLDTALKIARRWLNSEFFKKYGLFGFEIGKSFLKPAYRLIFRVMTPKPLNCDTAMMVKGNTNILYGLLKLYDITEDRKIKEGILKWSKSLKTDSNGIFYSYYNVKKGGSVISLESNHAILDTLLEIGHRFNREMIENVERCTNFWIKHADSSGLIPEGIKEPIPRFSSGGLVPRTRFINPCVSRLDSQTDFLVFLVKLFEITGNVQYYTSSINMLQAIMKSHTVNDGYVKYVDLPTRNKQEYVIETKYLSLLLKGFITHIEKSNGRKIINNSLLWNLLRDR